MGRTGAKTAKWNSGCPGQALEGMGFDRNAEAEGLAVAAVCQNQGEMGTFYRSSFDRFKRQCLLDPGGDRRCPRESAGRRGLATAVRAWVTRFWKGVNPRRDILNSRQWFR